MRNREISQLTHKLNFTCSELVLAYDATLEVFSTALELRDGESKGHTLRVTEMALSLAKVLGVNNNELVHIRRGALLHDVGNLFVPESILHRQGELTVEEWVTIHMHPFYAHEMIRTIEFLSPASDIPYCHHEKWDGSGYPRGLCGEAIPPGARIFAVVDAIDAITSNRPYRAARPFEAALEELIKMRGTQFDPAGVDVALEIAPAEWCLMKDQVEKEHCMRQT